MYIPFIVKVCSLLTLLQIKLMILWIAQNNTNLLIGSQKLGQLQKFVRKAHSLTWKRLYDVNLNSY